MACHSQYKDYLLVCGLAILLPTFFITSIVCMRWRRYRTKAENLSFAEICFQSILFLALLCYRFQLRAEYFGTICFESTGTDRGETILLLMFQMQVFELIKIFMFIIYGAMTLRQCIKDKCRRHVQIGSSLAKFPYIKRYFEICSDSCIICLSEFQSGEYVSLLHCDVRHVFHTSCVRQWLTKNPVCPLCKAHICPQKLKEFNSSAIRKLI